MKDVPVFSRDEAMSVLNGRRYVFVVQESQYIDNCVRCALRGLCWYNIRPMPKRCCTRRSRLDGRTGYWEETE